MNIETIPYALMAVMLFIVVYFALDILTTYIRMVLRRHALAKEPKPNRKFKGIIKDIRLEELPNRWEVITLVTEAFKIKEDLDRYQDNLWEIAGPVVVEKIDLNADRVTIPLKRRIRP